MWLILRMPQYMPAALKPLAAQTPPEMILIVSVFILISCFIDREAQISTEGLPTLSGLMLYHKSRCFVQSQQNIHILYCGTRGAFPQVVKDGDQQDSLIVARYRDLHIIPT